jgi:DNA-binding transcriptional regulator GbsR (MarR family)
MTGRLDILSVPSDISVMTEITDNRKPLPIALERFVLHWGEMGGQWGVNRSVSQIHALLYLSERPLTADEIADTLALARSNVSNSIKELLSWNLIRRVPIRGDRRDHFEAETDVWEMFLRIAAGRKEREIDPAVAVLKACTADAERDSAVSATARARLKDMLTFIEMMERWYAQMLAVPKPQIATAIRLGARVLNFLPGARKKQA